MDTLLCAATSSQLSSSSLIVPLPSRTPIKSKPFQKHHHNFHFQIHRNFHFEIERTRFLSGGNPQRSQLKACGVSKPEAAQTTNEAAVTCEDLCTSVIGLCDTVVGVLGGGQLGRMLCQEASKMGVKVAVLDPMENCPASAIAHKHVVGSFRDTSAVKEFAKGCGVLTVEIEHVDVETLDVLEKQGMDCQPNSSTIRLIQDKYLQKVHFCQYDVPLPDFMQIDCIESAEKAGDLFSYPLMIKSRRLAYDGRGNAVAYCKEGINEAVCALGGFERGLYAEKWAPFIKELAVIVARGRDGALCCFPVVETTHKDSICHTVEAPADVSAEIKKNAVRVAERAVSSLKGAGVFAVELFLTGDGQILLNEVAPRPHNSGHLTIEACYVSQFEQHLRAVLGLPLGDTSLKVPAAIMYNLLGEEEGERGFVKANQLMRRAVSIPGASVHWYEKPEMRKQRKMGHITVIGPSMDVVRERMKLIIDGNDQDGSFGTGSKQHVETSSNVSAKDVAINSQNDNSGIPQVGIIMGSDSDLPVMRAAAEVLESSHVPYEITIVSAHRTPERMVEYAKQAHGRGIKIIIAGAGGAAHLPGMVAAMTPLPVIGVPVRGSSLDGMDSLLSIVQMPKGVPVATIAIQNATTAGLLAVRILGITNTDLQRGSAPVGIIMGSDSDQPVMKAAAEVLESFQVPYEVTIVSVHQTPEGMVEYAKHTQERGIKIIIAGAGGAAHLPGMVAAMTPLPVIGVPVKGPSLDGMDSLLSTVQMQDVPVATLAIQNATNAGLLAVRMLGITDTDLHTRIIQYQDDMKKTVLKKAEKLETIGWRSYCML